MADRYWVGGTAAWDGTVGTKWATTSGGAGGASVPTTADAVFFTNLSTGTCTISAGNTGALSINCTGFTGTLAGTSNITVAGSITLVAGMSYSHTGTVSFTGTATLTTAGKAFSPITIIGAGITVTLGDALSIASPGNVSFTQGTFNTANFTVTCGQFVASGASAKTITLGSSTVNCTRLDFNATNLTFNSGTSQINHSSANDFTGNGNTFYNVALTGTAAGTTAVTGANTFNNFTVTGPAAAGVRQVTFAANQTFSGALGTTGTAGNRRVWFRSETYGIARTLTCNAAASLTDADFRDLYVVGTAAPISGTRIGDLRGIRGITASTPKTVYWNLAAGGNWSATAWAASSGGGVSTDNHPLAQDTAIIENTGLNTSATVTLDSAVAYLGTLNMSTRTNAMGLAATISYTIYGNWVNGSGTTISGTAAQTFSGRNTQTITSAGKTTTFPITIDTYGGSVELADAVAISGFLLTVTNGGFDSKNFNVTAAGIASSNSNVRSITLGSSNVTLTLTGTFAEFSTTTNLTFNAGTSTITATGANAAKTFNGGGLTFYNVDFGATANSGTVTHACNGANTFNNLSFDGQGTAAGISGATISANQTINGTLLIRAGGGAVTWRFFIRSDTLGTSRTLTAATLTATDADFRDITIAGAAAGSSPTRAGDCGGNSGITFPAAKTVYWNLAGTQNWSATGWAPSSGGTVDINQFPLAQDTAVFDNTGAAGTVTINANWNIGSINASTRTSAMTLAFSGNIHGNITLGSGLTIGSGTSIIPFVSRGTQTITSAGKTLPFQISVLCVTGTVQLGDALSTSSAIYLQSGTFDAVSYNVTILFFTATGITTARTLKMGSGTWTLTSSASVSFPVVWDLTTPTGFTLYKNTANIVLSDTTTGARTFTGGGFSYNKLTIGGTTGTSTLTITGNNQFTELASTKTVAHTIALGTTTQTLGKWTVTGTVGNVVTVTGTATVSIVGSRVSGVDYLALGTTVISATSPGEFYAGVNSTGGTNAILTAAPAAVTRYWVGGTGTWNAATTTNWSATSGGGGGASVPTSADAVVFDSASNATAYTVTCTATLLRCGSLTMAGPASGNVTWAGTAPLAIHGNVTLPATGLTRSYTGGIALTSNSTGLTFTTNGVALSPNQLEINGVDCGWSLGSALNIGSNNLFVINGTLGLSTYNLTCGNLQSDYAHSRTINLSSGTITVAAGSPINFGTTETNRANLTLTASTSQINISASATFSGNNQTFYNVSFTSTSAGTVTLNGVNSYNNLSFTGITAAGLKNISLTANQTVTGTLTCSAGTDATMRHFIQSNTLGTTRTITAAAVSLTNVDFRDITIAGAAAPAGGTRIGDCKGNSGITFTAAANKYWNLVGGGNWGGAIAWATSSGGSPAINNFPLAQDTAFIENTGLNASATVTINAAYNIGTLNMSSRTTAMTLTTSADPVVYGNVVLGTGVTPSGTNTITFAGRTSQTLTNAGRTFTQGITVNSPSGTVTLQDAFITNRTATGALTVTNGTFDAATYNVTLSGAAATFSSNNSNTRTVAVGSGTWTLAGSGTAWDATTSTGLTVTGTGTITLTSASAKTFAGGGVAYTNITLNQGGAGALTISGNNTFKDITNTYKGTGATSIALAATTQRVSQWTGAGEAARILTLSGTSAGSPGTLILTGATKPNVDYLSISNVRAYSLDTTWYAGTNSTNGGTLGWYFESGAVGINVSVVETATGSDAVSTSVVFSTTIAETGLGTDAFSALASVIATILEAGTGTDTNSALASVLATVLESGTGTDSITAVTSSVIACEIAEAAAATDAVSALQSVLGLVTDTASATEIVQAFAAFNAALADSATGTDQIDAVRELLGAITETASGAETFTAVASFTGTADELATGTDSTLVAPSTFNAPVAEAAVATDSFATNTIVYASISLTVTIADTVVARYLWEPVDDTQTPNWQTIGNAQSAGWVLIPNTQVSGWIPVKTIEDT